jgi:hypothetical protein
VEGHELFDLRPYWEVYGYAVDEAEGDPARTLADVYDPGRERTVRGRVSSVGTYYPDHGPGLVRLRIAADRGPSTFYVARDVLLAREIRTEAWRLRVRDEDGQPGWTRGREAAASN